jgi:hypothetical protein
MEKVQEPSNSESYLYAFQSLKGEDKRKDPLDRESNRQNAFTLAEQNTTIHGLRIRPGHFKESFVTQAMHYAYVVSRYDF